MKIVLASYNEGKYEEFKQLLEDSPIDLIFQRQCSVPEVEETGLSFVENAIIKARQACRYTGLAAIGDDSGLEVEALNGGPGIYSARYASKTGERGAATHSEKLLAEMAEVPAGQRQARFCCVLAYMRHAQDATPIIAQGFCEGEVAFEAVGQHGFGYDPVIYLPKYGCTVAELTAQIKNRISHRAYACASFLKQWLPQMQGVL